MRFTHLPVCMLLWDALHATQLGNTRAHPSYVRTAIPRSYQPTISLEIVLLATPQMLGNLPTLTMLWRVLQTANLAIQRTVL